MAVGAEEADAVAPPILSDNVEMVLKLTDPTEWMTGMGGASSEPGAPSAGAVTLVLLVSSRLESSSKTDLRESSLWTMGLGWVGFLRSRENLFRLEQLAPGVADAAALGVPTGVVDGPVKDGGKV